MSDETTKIVLVQWFRPATTENWIHKDDLKKEVNLIETLGFLIDYNNLCLCVASSICEKAEQYSQVINIPNECVETIDVVSQNGVTRLYERSLNFEPLSLGDIAAVRITVNGTEKIIPNNNFTLTFDEIVRLVFKTTVDCKLFSVTSRKGCESPEVILAEDESIKVEDGMLFDVFVSDPKQSQ